MAACDTHNGILLCIDEKKYRRGHNIPEYIVCKPATKQYQIIRNPRNHHFFTLAIGFMVVQSNPFRYKIVRVSQPSDEDRKKTREGFYNSDCEIFDSQLCKWKRSKDLELPQDEFLKTSSKPVSVYGFLHWLTKKYVVRFCMRTETWSSFPVPDHLVDRNLVSYEGKLGLIGLRGEEKNDLWVLENSFGKSWIVVKDVKTTGLQNNKDDERLWFPSNDVVSTAGRGRLGVYNMNSSNIRYIHKDIEPLGDLNNPWAIQSSFSFYSNYDRIDLKKDHVRRSNRKGKDCKGELGRIKERLMLLVLPLPSG